MLACRSWRRRPAFRATPSIAGVARRGVKALGRLASTRPPGTLSSQEKFAVVLETASLNKSQLGAYCRSMGVFAEQIDV